MAFAEGLVVAVAVSVTGTTDMSWGSEERGDLKWIIFFPQTSSSWGISMGLQQWSMLT